MFILNYFSIIQVTKSYTHFIIYKNYSVRKFILLDILVIISTENLNVVLLRVRVVGCLFTCSLVKSYSNCLDSQFGQNGPYLITDIGRVLLGVYFAADVLPELAIITTTYLIHVLKGIALKAQTPPKRRCVAFPYI